MRVAAVQMTPVLADVERNLESAERLVGRAAAQGAELIVLPEFFTSAMAFHPAMAGAVEPIDGRPLQLLRRLAAQSGAAIGGSYLAWRRGRAHNSFVLVSPDGAIGYHDKDHPTFLENCYYEGGDDDGVLAPAVSARVGVALCWEFIRTRTVARLIDRVDLVIGGSCWWQRSDADGSANHALLREAPRSFARLLGVPVVHASHAGRFEGGTAATRNFTSRPFHYLGEAQIVDGDGTVLARLAAEDGEGVIVADVSTGAAPLPRLPLPDRFWIPELPEGWDEAWRTALVRDHGYYLEHTRPELLARFENR